ncbi:MAG: cytochrome b/b6 domain-containing protein [Hyphomicrobiaceae bacterium]|nr:cytochrome b/b6 domain-containing protein [Hyphomicrobiaceae bacterium]
MTLLNGPDGYGGLTKALHWIILVLFVFQFTAAAVMLNLGPNDALWGATQANVYNWHKSIGLLALGLALVRIGVRNMGRLPGWAASLTARERVLVHYYERLLYAGMLGLPASGFVYVMAGGNGVHLFEIVHLANPIGKSVTLALVAKWVHIVSAYVILAAIAVHVGLVARHHVLLGNGLLWRMLPGRGHR